nr:EOG090X08W6 [Polyphemus pediculus]
MVQVDLQVEWLVRSIQCIDLTTLAGDDCVSNVLRLCSKAANPVSVSTLDHLGLDSGQLTTGAVCVYPAQVKNACSGLQMANADIPVASVATGFPSGQTSLSIRLDEIKFAVESGAKEIDIVINRELALSQKWEELYHELVEMRKACGESHMKSILAVGELSNLTNVYRSSLVAMMAGSDFIKTSTGKETVNATLPIGLVMCRAESHMKSILAVGELSNLTNVYRSSLVAMMAGSDFIKTSTGKETVNATLPIGLVMCRAIQAYHQKTGHKVGFKPAGGIRTSKDVIQWMTLMKEELGDEYVQPHLFRIGASALLNDIERNVSNYFVGGYSLPEEMPMA